MDRRAFIKSLFATGVLVATSPDINTAIEQFLTETAPMSDSEFVMYVKYTINILVNNPARCVIIDNIGEPTNE